LELIDLVERCRPLRRQWFRHLPVVSVSRYDLICLSARRVFACYECDDTVSAFDRLPPEVCVFDRRTSTCDMIDFEGRQRSGACCRTFPSVGASSPWWDCLREEVLLSRLRDRHHSFACKRTAPH